MSRLNHTLRLGLKELTSLRHDSVLLPSAAVQRNAQGAFVYKISKEDQTVTPRPVELGPVNGETIVVEKGLEAGDQVVLAHAVSLAARNWPIQRIAAELDYSPSAFSAMVRRTVGMPPAQFFGMHTKVMATSD